MFIKKVFATIVALAFAGVVSFGSTAQAADAPKDAQGCENADPIAVILGAGSYCEEND